MKYQPNLKSSFYKMHGMSHLEATVLLRYLSRKYSLTPREFDTLTLISLGMSRKETGKAMGISYSTVHSRTKIIFKKLGINCRISAIIVFIQLKYASQNKSSWSESVALRILTNKYRLTRREQQIVALYGKGQGDQEYASKILGIAVGTLKVHMRNIKHKMQINSIYEITIIYQNTLHDANYAHDHSSWIPQKIYK